MKKDMKNRISVTSIVLMLLMGLPQILMAQSEGEFAVPLSDPGKRGKLIAQLNTGSITVKGTARKDILVKYSQVLSDKQKDKGGETKDGLKRISSGTMDLEVTENSNTVKVGSDSWSNRINLIIEVPSGFDMKVKAYNNGDILITDVQGEVEITNYNGEITAKNISGSVVASTYNGDIKITFDKLTEGTPMSYSTYNGDIDLTFPPSFKGSLKLKTERGEIYTGFDVNLIKTGPVQKSESKSGTYRVTIDDWVKGDVNGGGPEFTMKNYNGDIIIRKKQ
ncbi:MAG TPA: hypothetical protein DIS90_04910 [Cytophagales bacterium]|nr:hypothetical protein [Cytophagales bacterium]HCR54460.1 hypothetical protein [Cytophagales bacterium]